MVFHQMTFQIKQSTADKKEWGRSEGGEQKSEMMELRQVEKNPKNIGGE